MIDISTELEHLEACLHMAVAAALRGKPETDLHVHDALAILDHLKTVANVG